MASAAAPILESRASSDHKIDPSTCVITLDETLEINHRGNAVAAPQLRIQAGAQSQRSVLITGGYLSDSGDPSTRVATAYSYANNEGQPTASLMNTGSCQDIVDGQPVARPER